MSGLRFESMADMPPRMRELYAKQAAGAADGSRRSGHAERHCRSRRMKTACGEST